jgi:lysophospholipase L1-like esterase
MSGDDDRPRHRAPRLRRDPWYRRLRRSDRPNLDADNAARESFNDQMRAAFAGQGTLFDLADVESTGPGHRPSAVKGPRSLDRHYTDDGGHLNEKGRERAAECLLRCLADLSAPAAEA